jgi:hypothetical protein
MKLQNVRISTLVVYVLLGYAASACSGGASDGGMDAPGAGGAADVSGQEAQAGTGDDFVQPRARITPHDAAWAEHPVTKIEGLGGPGLEHDMRLRAAEPEPAPVPEPSPFK